VTHLLDGDAIFPVAILAVILYGADLLGPIESLLVATVGIAALAWILSPGGDQA